MPESFVEGIKDNAANRSIEVLNDRLVQVIDLTLAVKQAHWNIKGTNFIGVHELLDDVADRLREIGDEIAERAVILGGIARGTAEEVAGKSSLEPYPVEETDIAAHLDALVSRFKAVGKSLREAIDIASESGDEGTADLFTSASRSVDKDAWFLGANRS